MDRGFTIIEVLLFISVSGLIVLMALTGFTSSIDANRRIDTNRSFEAAIEAEFASVRAGSVVRMVAPDGKVVRCTPGGARAYPGASDECIVIGKLLKIQQGTASTVTVYNVVANVEPVGGCTESSIRGVIDCYEARVVDMSEPTDSFSPEWGAQINGIDFQSKSGTAYRPYAPAQTAHIAILRDPVSELVYMAPLNIVTGNNGFADLTDTGVNSFANAKGQICLKHEGLLAPKSYLRFTGGEGLGSIDFATDPLFTGVTPC